MQGVCEVLGAVPRGVAPPITSKVKGLVTQLLQQLALFLSPLLCEAMPVCSTMAKNAAVKIFAPFPHYRSRVSGNTERIMSCFAVCALMVQSNDLVQTS